MDFSFFIEEKKTINNTKKIILDVLKPFHYSNPKTRIADPDTLWQIVVFDSKNHKGWLCSLSLIIRHNKAFSFAISYESNMDLSTEILVFYLIRDEISRKLGWDE